MNAGTRLRVFVSAGEASGEALAADLLAAMRAGGARLEVEGVGGERLAAAGVRIVQSNAGWASLGPLAALGKIPRLLAIAGGLALRLRAVRYDLIVLVDFGAFHLRLAGLVRATGCATPILYYFPPGAWFDDPARARRVAGRCDALTAFTHQRDFYRALGLPIAWYGHPLLSAIEPRAERPPAAPDGGVVALLPGSRAGEIARHTPLLLGALQLLRDGGRPRIEGLLPAADESAATALRAQLARWAGLPATVVPAARSALAGADAAAIASGTAVLEAALLEVPAVALYVLSEAQARVARRVYHRPYVTLPNLVLDEPVVPELLQAAATPAALAQALDALLARPAAQLPAYRRLRTALGPADALARCARFALELAAR